MGIYVDADDIRQHFRQGGGLSVEIIEEIMQEQETYVRQTLKLDTLPPEHDVLKSIIRNLTIAECIYQMTPATADNLIKADTQRREANRKLREIDRSDLGMSIPGTASNEVYNPYPSMFLPSDFGLVTDYED